MSVLKMLATQNYLPHRADGLVAGSLDLLTILLKVSYKVYLDTISLAHPVYRALQEILNRTFFNLYALDQALLVFDSKGGH
nr:hypothetical protein [Tanacetum cinerariifolium]